MSVCSGYLCTFNPPMVGSLPADMQWGVLALTASILIVIVHGMILGISRAFSMNDLERYAKSEILNAVATALMVIFLLSTLQAVQTFAIGYFFGCTGSGTGIPNAIGGGVSGCVKLSCAGVDVGISDMKDSIDLLKCRLSNKASGFADLQQQIMQTAVSGNPFSAFNRLQFYIGFVGVPVFSGQYIGSWFREAETYRLLNTFITTFLIGSNTLIVAAEYIKNNMLSFYLPLGLLLRAFPYTRGIGAFFIALAIGLYFIYPLLYVITDPGYVKPSYSPAQSAPKPGLCYPTFSSITYAISSSNTGSTSSGGVDLSLTQLSTDIASVYTSLLIQPFVIFAITMIFVRYMTYVFGGEPNDILRALAKVV